MVFRIPSKAIFFSIAFGFLLLQTTQGQEKKTNNAKAFASIGDVPITEAQVRAAASKDLDALEMQMQKAKANYAQSEYQILRTALARIVEDKLLQAEAAKRGIAKEELTAKEFQPTAEDPSTEEIDSFYEANKQNINKSKEDITPQIKQFLKQQKDVRKKAAFIKQLEKEYKLSVSLAPLRFEVNAPGHPSLGPASAPVTLVEFSDFQCSHCKTYSETLKQVLKLYGDKVRLVFRQMPIPSLHPYAEKAAVASLCADAQGHFWEMHDFLFQNQPALNDEFLKSKAGSVGLNAEEFNKCFDSGRFSAYIDEDVHAAARGGVDGTPTLFVNGIFLPGRRSYEEIAAVIDEELARK